MSTTVQYKGNTLTTVSNATKTLKTAGKYMEGDVSITDTKIYTATISGTGNINYCYVRLNNTTKYYTTNDTFQFKEGDSLYCYGYYSGGQFYIEVNSQAVTSIGSSASYTYTMPAKDIQISLQYSAQGMISILESVIPTAGYWNGQTITPSTNTQTIFSTNRYYTGNITVNPIPSQYIIPSGTLSITQNGTKDVTNYASVSVNVSSGSTINNQDKTVSPTESTQYVTADEDYTGLGTVTVNAISSTYVGSEITQRSSTNLSVSGATVTAPAGYYAESASKSVASGTAGTPSATKGTVSNHAISVTPSVTNTTGYITGGTKTGTAVTVSASELVSGTKSITSNGSSDITNYASVNVNVESEDFVITMSYNSTSELWEPDCTYAEAYSAYTANKNIVAKANNFTPVYIEYNTNEEAFVYRISEPWDDQSGYTWGFYDKVYIWASSGITVEDNQTYYSIRSGNAVPSDVANGKVFFNAQGVQIGTATVSSEIQVAVATPQSGANGYLLFGDLLGAPTSFSLINTYDITLDDTPIVSALTFDGTNYVGQLATNLSNANARAMSTGFNHSYDSQENQIGITSENAAFDTYSHYILVYTYGGSASDIHTADVQVGSGATSITFPVTGRPTYWSCVFKSDFGTSSGYQRVIAVANNGTNTYGLCLDSSAHASNSYWTANYSGGNFTISSQSTNAGGYFHQPGYYQLTYIVDDSAPSYQTKTVTPTTSQQTVTADSGYDALSQVTVNAMPTGIATSATTISGTAATVSTGTNTLTLTKTVSNTPRITTAGYISTGTAGNSSVTLTANVTTKAAATITPGTTNQTIAAGTYLTGTQTIAGDADLVGSNIISTANIFGTQGTVVIQKYYTGANAPSSSLGNNGDIYLQE